MGQDDGASSSADVADQFHNVDLDINDDPDDIPSATDDHIHEDTDLDSASMQSLAAKMIMQLRASSSVTMTSVMQMIRGSKVMFESAFSSVRHQMFDVMTKHGVNTNSDDAQRLCDQMIMFENPFSGLETPHQQMKFMTSNMNIVMPEERTLGFRYDQVMDRQTGITVQKVVTETYQYISVKGVLALVLNNEEARLLIENERFNGDLLRSYKDGLQYHQNAVLRDHPNAIRIQLYYDDLELANPLGSKTKIHKLGAFYFCIENLPRRYNSVMSSVHLLAVCHSMDLKKYGFDAVLRPFMYEMRELESDAGMTINIDGKNVQVHGTLTTLSADSLAAHEMLGFMSPSANRLCRLCLSTRDDIQSRFDEGDVQMRNIEEHDEHVHRALENRSHGDPTTGVRGHCGLNDLRGFHCVANFNLDIMHDLFEGVCPFEVKLILKDLIFCKGLFTVKLLNERIKAFPYGFADRKNKPSVISAASVRHVGERGLGQKAKQMECLIHMLPLIVGDLIPLNDECWELFMLLRRIMDIVCSPVVARSEMPYLKHLIIEHHSLFRELFPDVRMINKHHHMVHYPTCILNSGPMTTMQCLKYELKHNFSKRFAHIMCNFKNVCKSMAFKHQVYQCSNWSGKGLRCELECTRGAMASVDSLAGEAVIRETLGIQPDNDVFVADEVVLFGIVYRPGFFIIIDIDDPDNDVDLEVLQTITEEDMLGMGIVSFGTRRKLSIAINRLPNPLKPDNPTLKQI